MDNAHRAAWDALDEAKRGRVLARLAQASAARALADRDLYASNATLEPTVEVYGARRDGETLVVDYLFSWWEWCPAQSGSDWNYHCVYRGAATLVGERYKLEQNDVEAVCRDYVHEYDEKNYDREAVLAEVRKRLMGSSG